MCRRQVRQLQQLLSNRKQRGPSSAIASRNASSSAEDGLLLCYYRFFRSPFLLVLLALIAATMYSSYSSIVHDDIAIVDIGSDDIVSVAAIAEDDDTTLQHEPRRKDDQHDEPRSRKDQPPEKRRRSDRHEPRTKGKRERGKKDNNEDPHGFKLSIQQSTLDHLRTLSDFPKIVHLIWPDKTILSKGQYEIIEHGAKNLQRLNPDWKFIVHDYDSIDETIQNFRHPDIPASMNEDLARAHIVEKTDAFRLMKIYEMGGLYVDIDRVMNVHLNQVIDVTKVKLVLATHYDINFTNDLFGSSPKNDLILEAFRKQCLMRETFERKKGWIKVGDQMDLVETYTAAIETGLYGENIGSFDESRWDEARNVLTSGSDGMIVTYKDVWCDGLLVNDFDGCKDIRRESLYEAYNIEAWDDVVNEMWESKGDDKK